LAGLPKNVLDRHAKGGIFTDDGDVLRLDQITKPSLQRSAYAELQSGGNFRTSWLKDHTKEASAKIWPVHAFSGCSKQDLFNHVAHVVFQRGVSCAPVKIEVKWKVDEFHAHVPVALVCVDTINKGVPVGAHIA